MPLFGRTHEPVQTQTVVQDPPKRHSSIFHSNRSVSPAKTTTTHHTTHSGNSISPARHSHSLLHRDREDSSITSARDRVLSAEAAERDADKALLTARAAVREARDHVRRLEKEAAEEARLAKIKQKQAGALGKRGKALGRHGDI